VAKIAMYAGHGGSDPGAVGNGLMEKNFTLGVSNQASNILRSWGYTVLNNRTTDTDRNITRDANLANENNVDAVIELHLNSNAGTPATGTEAFISIHDKGQARAIANAILSRIATLGYRNRGVKTQANAAGQDAFGIIRQTRMPAVLVELAFINNPQDMARFNVNEMALAVASGIRDVIPIGENGSNNGSGALPPYPGTLLRVGASGESVRQVQSRLNKVGERHSSIPRINEDGIFGPKTYDAIVAFQKLFSLNPDGVVGPLTWDKLMQESYSNAENTCIMPPFDGVSIRPGTTGETVRQMQCCLNRVGQSYPEMSQLVEDGVFGVRTLTVITTFQRIFGLVPDGIVGSLTWTALSQACSA